MEPAKVYNRLTSRDRLQQYERGKVQCTQSGERYLPIWKKKVTMCYTQCYTVLHYVICYYKLFPSLGNSFWFISCLNVAWSGTELLSLGHLIPHVTYCSLTSNIQYLTYVIKGTRHGKMLFKRIHFYLLWPLWIYITILTLYVLLHHQILQFHMFAAIKLSE